MSPTEKRVALAFGILLTCIIVYVLARYPDNSSRSARGSGSADDTSRSANAAQSNPYEPSPNLSRLTREALDGGVPSHTIRDVKLRDDMRRRIYEAWSRGAAPDPDPSPSVHEVRYESMPQRPDGGIDPTYIQQRFREDFFPMAKDCYDELLKRDPKAEGKITVNFRIVGDEKIGGLVDDATIDDESTLKDDKMQTCFRESVMAVAFRPPPAGGGGVVTVKYPIIFSPNEPDE